MNSTRSEIEKFIPRDEAEYDVIVCGSGFSGLGATIAAAEQGARTLLIEARPYFGGVGNICLWMPAFLMYPPRETDKAERRPRGGAHRRLLAGLEGMGHDAYDPLREAIHPDYLRLAIPLVLEELGCHYLLNSPVSGVLREANRVVGVEVTCKGRKQTFRGRVVVDATGDADVAALAGAEFRLGRDEDGMLMPVTLTFVLGNVDLHRLLAFKPGKLQPASEEKKLTPQQIMENYRKNPATATGDDAPFYAIMQEAAGEGMATACWYAFTGTTIPGVVTVNNGGPLDAGNVNGLRATDLTYAERAGAQIAVDFVVIARRWAIPGLEHCNLLRVGPAVAMRETRRIVGDYTLTSGDLREGRDFEDSVARIYETRLDTVYHHGKASGNTGVPYRCFLPSGVEGLLVTGRCFSIEHQALGGARSMGTVMAYGEACGVAAALAAKGNLTPRRVNVKDIQTVLAGIGAKL